MLISSNVFPQPSGCKCHGNPLLLSRQPDVLPALHDLRQQTHPRISGVHVDLLRMCLWCTCVESFKTKLGYEWI